MILPFCRPFVAACLGICLAGAVAPASARSEWKALSPPEGQEAAPLELADLGGHTVDLSAIKGEVVLVNFWATWCQPCREEMPSLDRLHRQLGGKRLRVVGVNIGEGRARIEEFLAKVPVGFTIVRDTDMETMKSWRVRVLPATFLVDARGMLRYQLVGDANWDDAKVRAPILQLMKEARPWSSSSSARKPTPTQSAAN